MSRTSAPVEAAQAIVATPTTQAERLATAVATLDRDLEGKHEALAAALAGAYDPRYFQSVALSQFRRSPGLWDVVRTVQGRVSFVDAVVQAAQYGLPFLAGRAYLVPFKNKGTDEAQLIVGYQGLVDLVTAPGTGVTYVEAAVVYERDAFEYERGTNAYLRHVPYHALDDGGVVDRGRPVAAWARVVYATGQSRFDVMNVTEIEAVRRRSRAGQAGPWVTDWDPMACKTVLRRLCKTLRISLRVMEVVDREEQFEQGAPAPAPTPNPQAGLRRRLAERVAPDVAAQAAENGPGGPEEPAPAPAPEPPAAPDPGRPGPAVDGPVDALWTVEDSRE